MILCFSGGLDSLIAWHYLGYPKCVFFRCTDYSDTELISATTLNPNVIIDNSLNVQHLQVGKNAYIPHRNLIFAALASNYDNDVVIAGVKDDKVEDKNPLAFKVMGDVLSKTSKSTITVTSPFWKMTKSSIVAWFLDHVPDARMYIQQSVSCYSDEKYCGRCPSCFRKANALFENGIDYPFFDVALFTEYYEKALRGCYTVERNYSIVRFYKHMFGE